jgi:uncharacterized repeat protein (TIGR03803 family)
MALHFSKLSDSLQGFIAAIRSYFPRRASACRTACLLALICAVMGLASSAQTFKSLTTFDETTGYNPPQGLVQGLDGNFYGTTEYGGLDEGGTIFKVTPGGNLTVLYNFCSLLSCTDGSFPNAGLVLGTDGDFYGTTTTGGTSGNCNGYTGCGTVFKITRAGVLTTLCSFENSNDGSTPYAALTQGTDGNFYGTTQYGGSKGTGTIFKITPGGSLTTLHAFDGADGKLPGALVQASDGNFYGTTAEGGANSEGTVYKLTPTGTFTTLYSFCQVSGCPDGYYPEARLVQETDGNLYGTTFDGALSNYYCASGCGTVFRITLQGILTTLHEFAGPEGTNPAAPLIQATDGNFYGTAAAGGDINGVCDSFAYFGCGSIFKMTPAGKLTTSHLFSSLRGVGPDGMVQGTNGNFYGTTFQGGPGDYYGTVFTLSVGLAPFVESLPPYGVVGAAVRILGNNLTGTTSVTFNGTSATFTVVSSTQISATVPAGAKNGTVQVVTPSGTLSSNVPFTVLP